MMTVQECINYVESHLEVRYATSNRAYKEGRVINPNGGLNHSVGCAQPKADVIYNLMNSSSVNWGVNAILGDFHTGEGRIIVTMPLNGRPWGCGQGSKGSWNNSRIQWEICEPAGHTYAGGSMINYDVSANQAYFDRMWKMLVAWNVYLIDKFGYKVSGISDHSEAYVAGYGSNHGDMNQWLPKHGKSMSALRDEVQAILNNTNSVKEDDSMARNDMDVQRFAELMLEYRATLQDNDASDYSEQAREWARNTGLIAGGSTTDFNGMWQDFLTREQLVTILYKYAKMLGLA